MNMKKSFIYSFTGFHDDDTHRYNNAYMYVSAESREKADEIFSRALNEDGELTIIAERNHDENGNINKYVEVNEMRPGNTFAFITLGDV